MSYSKYDHMISTWIPQNWCQISNMTIKYQEGYQKLMLKSKYDHITQIPQNWCQIPCTIKLNTHREIEVALKPGWACKLGWAHKPDLTKAKKFYFSIRNPAWSIACSACNRGAWSTNICPGKQGVLLLTLIMGHPVELGWVQKCTNLLSISQLTQYSIMPGTVAKWQILLISGSFIYLCRQV